MKTRKNEFLNYKVYYVPFTKDTIYPIYVPIVVNEPDVLLSSGSLSENDYKINMDLVESCGIPALIPLIASLAPIVIPAAIKGFKKLRQKIRGNGEFDERSEKYRSGYIPTNPNIKNLKQLQQLYNNYK